MASPAPPATGAACVGWPDTGYLLTNAHVAGATVCPRECDGLRVVIDREVGRERRSLRGARLIFADEDLDLALLKVEVDEPVPWLQVAARDVAEGDRLHVIGFPHGGPKASMEARVQAALPNELRSTPEAYPGQSGSPVLDDDGRLVAHHWGHWYGASPAQSLDVRMTRTLERYPELAEVSAEVGDAGAAEALRGRGGVATAQGVQGAMAAWLSGRRPGDNEDDLLDYADLMGAGPATGDHLQFALFVHDALREADGASSLLSRGFGVELARMTASGLERGELGASEAQLVLQRLAADQGSEPRDLNQWLDSSLYEGIDHVAWLAGSHDLWANWLRWSLATWHDADESSESSRGWTRLAYGLADDPAALFEELRPTEGLASFGTTWTLRKALRHSPELADDVAELCAEVVEAVEVDWRLADEGAAWSLDDRRAAIRRLLKAASLHDEASEDRLFDGY